MRRFCVLWLLCICWTGVAVGQPNAPTTPSGTAAPVPSADPDLTGTSPATGSPMPPVTPTQTVPVSNPPVAPASPVTVEEILAVRQQLEAATDFTDELKGQVVGLLKQTEDGLVRLRELEAEGGGFLARRETLAVEKSNVEAQLRSWDEEPTAEPVPDISLVTLSTELAEHQRLLGELKGKRDSFMGALQSRSKRRELLRLQQIETDRRLTSLATQLATSPPASEPKPLSDALRLSLLVQQAIYKLLPVATANELALYDAEEAMGLPGLRRELLDVELRRKEKEVKAWDTAAKLRRENAVADRMDRADAAVNEAPEEVKGLFQANLAIVKAESAAVTEIRGIDQQVADVIQRRATLQASFDSLKARELKAKGSTLLGVRLRQQKELLDDPLELRHAVDARRNDVEDARLQLLDYEDQLGKLVEIEAEVERFLSEEGLTAGAAESPIAVEATAAFQQRKKLLPEAIKAYQAYNDSLDALDREQLSLSELNEEMLEWINARALWIQSHQLVTPRQLARELPALSWMTRTDWLLEVYNVLKTDIWLESGWYLLAIVLFLVLKWRRRKQREKRREYSEIARRKSNTDFAPTGIVTLITLVMSIYRPAIVLFVAWRMREAVESTLFVRHLGDNLLLLGWIGAFVEFTRQGLRSGGLADSHLGWTERAVALLNRSLRQLVLFGLPIAVVVALLSANASTVTTKFWERLAFAGRLVFVALLFKKLANASTGVLLDWYRTHPGSWPARLHSPISFIIVSLPLVLAGFALYGYYYTATELAVHFVQTLVLIEFAVLTRALLMRSLTLKRRRLAIEQARERRQSLSEEPRVIEPGHSVEVAKPFISLSELNAQSLQLVNTLVAILGIAGCWYIWSDVLPALNQINTSQVWTTYETVAGGSVATASPSAATTSPASAGAATDVAVLSTIRHSVTISDLLRALVVTWLVYAAARNFPALLDMTLLQQLPLDRSVKYAIAALTRYLIVLAGILVVGNMLGLSWSSVQWLAAALTFGLAFGLQEIFANFVSGLIILFEQPVRVGDIVTIDGVSGIVSRIRMRSTTITDWDHKELVVPNREFITNKLLNWTLTDAMTRVVIQFETSYASDPQEVLKLVQRLASDHPQVLDEPPPRTTFDSFGSSGLVFKLRAFVAEIESRLQTQSELNTSILYELRRAGIEIPFPQQDLHIRSLPAEWLGLPRTEGGVVGDRSSSQGTAPPDEESLPGL